MLWRCVGRVNQRRFQEAIFVLEGGGGVNGFVRFGLRGFGILGVRTYLKSQIHTLK